MALSFEQVGEILDELAEQLPDEPLQGLTGGISLLPEAKHNAQIPSDRYYVLGEYIRGGAAGTGTIAVYYGSFAALYPRAGREEAREVLDGVLRHELRHHLEGRAGLRDLEVEDEKFVIRANAELERERRRR